MIWMFGGHERKRLEKQISSGKRSAHTWIALWKAIREIKKRRRRQQMSIMRLFGEYENTFEVSFLELHLCASYLNFEAVVDCALKMEWVSEAEKWMESAKSPRTLAIPIRDSSVWFVIHTEE